MIDGVTVATASTKIAEADTTRSVLILTNDSNEVMYLAATEDAVMNKGVMLAVASDPFVISRGVHGALVNAAWNGICTSGGKVCAVLAR